MGFDLMETVGLPGASTVGGLYSAYQAKTNNDKNRDQQQRQFDTAQTMANSSHQREVSDLLAAGLNPILSGTGGSGLGATSAGSVSSGNVPNPFQDGVNTALSERRLNADTNLTNAQAQTQSTAQELNAESARKARLEGDLLEKFAPLLQKQIIEKTTSEAHSAATTAKLLNNELPQSANSAEVSGSTFGRVMSYIERLLPTINSASTANRSVGSSGRRK